MGKKYVQKVDSVVEFIKMLQCYSTYECLANICASVNKRLNSKAEIGFKMLSKTISVFQLPPAGNIKVPKF